MNSTTLSLAKDLIARPSVTPNDKGCQTLLADRLSKMGFEITHYPFKQVNNLWAKKGTGSPVLCFAGHTDVVPPGDLSAWSSTPFEPTLRNGKLYGRGAADMKSSIAAMLTACERFFETHPQPRGSIAFLITSDEEGMAQDGTKAVLKALHARQEIPQWCLVGEASSDQKLGDTIKVGRRGTLTGTLKIIGQQGHVAYPQFARNAIHLALKPFEAMTVYEWDKAIPPFPATTLQFSNIHAGTGANNVIPGTLEAIFNLRFSPHTTPEKIQQTVAEILKSHGCDYQLNWHLGGLPFYTPPESQLLNIISKTMTETLGLTPLHSTSGGTSDGRFFAEYGCEVVEVGPCNATIHQVNECIDIKELEKLSLLYEKILEALLV